VVHLAETGTGRQLIMNASRKLW